MQVGRLESSVSRRMEWGGIKVPGSEVDIRANSWESTDYDRPEGRLNGLGGLEDDEVEGTPSGTAARSGGGWIRKGLDQEGGGECLHWLWLGSEWGCIRDEGGRKC